MQRSLNSRLRGLIYFLASSGLVLMMAPASAQDSKGPSIATVTGSGTIMFRHLYNFRCHKAVLVPANGTNLKGIPTSGTSVLMDWQYDDAISAIRKTPGAVEVTCNIDGAFTFPNINPGNFTLLVHFHWLRGKWSSGGWLAQELAVQGVERNVVLQGHME